MGAGRFVVVVLGLALVSAAAAAEHRALAAGENEVNDDQLDLPDVFFLREAKWWRPDEHAKDKYKCLWRDACPGSGLVRDGCGDGYTGGRCLSCENNYYHTARKKCQKCDMDLRVGAIVAYGVLLILLVVGAFVASFSLFTRQKSNNATTEIQKSPASFRGSDVSQVSSSRPPGDYGRGPPSEIVFLDGYRSGDYWSVVKCTLASLQIVATLRYNNEEVAFPQSYSYAQVVASLANLDVLELVPPSACFFGTPKVYFMWSLLLRTIAPVVLVIAVLVFGGKSLLLAFFPDREKASGCRVMFLKFVVFCGHFLAISACVACARALRCTEKYELGHSDSRAFLVAEQTISCESRLFTHFLRPYAVVALVAYLSLPVAMTAVLYKARKYVESENLKKIKVAGLSLAWKPYFKRYYLWEPVDLAKRVFLTAGLVFLQGAVYPRNRFLVGFVVALLFAVISNEIKPYVSPLDSRFYYFTNLTTAFTFLVAYVAAPDGSVGLVDSRADALLVILAVAPLAAAFLVVTDNVPQALKRGHHDAMTPTPKKRPSLVSKLMKQKSQNSLASGQEDDHESHVVDEGELPLDEEEKQHFPQAREVEFKTFSQKSGAAPSIPKTLDAVQEEQKNPSGSNFDELISPKTQVSTDYGNVPKKEKSPITTFDLRDNDLHRSFKDLVDPSEAGSDMPSQADTMSTTFDILRNGGV